jgi:hypothetical protein
MRGDPIIHKVYLGAPVDEESERKFLASAIEWLEAHKIAFVILANCHIGGRQIDCVVATEHSVSVVEIKSSYLPVRGEVNGDWARLHASGKWRAYPNAYQQALSAKNALRDAMTAVKPVGKFYPDGHVVFTSGLAEGSQVTTGDFKVDITTLDQYRSTFKVQGTVPWSLHDWHALATTLALTPVSVDVVVMPPKEWEWAEVLRRYSGSFAAEYGRDAARWLPEDAEQRTDLRTAAISGTGCFISGASGCGKTLMAKWIAVDLANAGSPTFFFAAKDFTGSWVEIIRREIALLSDQSLATVFRAISRADRAVFLVLDGINELGAHRPAALRGLRALARRLGAKVIITAQEEKLPEFDGLRSFAVHRPSLDLKCRIAQSGGVALNRIALDVLNAVGSGIEAEIVGQIGGDLKADATRLVLFDQYIRMRAFGFIRTA